MTDLSPESRALLGLEGPLDEPSAAELDVRREAIFRALGVPPPSALPTPTADTAPTPEPATVELPESPQAPVTPPASLGLATSWPTGTKLALAFAAAAVLAVGGLLLTPDAEEPTQPPDAPAGAPPSVGSDAGAEEPLPDTSPDDTLAGDTLEAPDPEPLPEPRRDGAGERPVAQDAEPQATPNHLLEAAPEVTTSAVNTPTEPADTEAGLAPDPLSEESMLVAAGEAQLRAGHATNALTLFERALARHPRGTLRVEALAGRALALCRAGRADAGQREAARFLAAYPRSPSAPRIREACGLVP